MKIESLSEIAGDRRAEQVQQVLADLARQLGPNSKLPTTRDLRKAMRISQATLDSALDGMELQGLIHRRHGSGVYVSPMIKLKRIAVVMAHGVFETRSETFDHILFRALGPEAKRRNYLVSYHFADVDRNEDEHGPHQLATDAQQGRIDAMVIRGPLSRHSQEVQSIRLPSVFVTSDKNAKPRIEFDASSVIGRGVALLAEAGCRRIGFAYPDYPSGGEHPPAVKVFKEALALAGLSFGQQWLIPFGGGSIASRPLSALSRFHKCWQEWSEKPDGFLSTDDQFTSGVVHACELMDVKIPDDLVIATHANKGLELFAQAQVIRLEFDPSEIACAILATIDELLQTGTTSAEARSVSSHVVMPQGTQPGMQPDNRPVTQVPGKVTAGQGAIDRVAKK
jgi:DNA-binding LacI/PurR family transcriptional regulator